ncbi:MAG TPA: TadE/TadG family type IV pilus assembly protein [Bacilli bacterium]|nr:TadE/TadG family type IV pilus assembly protein [Bacilli bacterium]
MKSSKGQALIEFVIILPVFLMLIFAIIDFGRVIYEKNMLENVVSTASELYDSGKTYNEIESVINSERLDKLDMTIVEKDGYVTIRISETVKPITPGFSMLKTRVFNISTYRVLYYE